MEEVEPHLGCGFGSGPFGFIDGHPRRRARSLARFGGIFFGLFLVNLLRGPTCVCQIRTAVQTERLPTLKRLRTARKVIARLKPMIEQTQSPLAPAQLGPRPPGAFVANPIGSSGSTAIEITQPPPTSSNR